MGWDVCVCVYGEVPPLTPRTQNQEPEGRMAARTEVPFGGCNVRALLLDEACDHPELERLGSSLEMVRTRPTWTGAT